VAFDPLLTIYYLRWSIVISITQPPRTPESQCVSISRTGVPRSALIYPFFLITPGSTSDGLSVKGSGQKLFDFLFVALSLFFIAHDTLPRTIFLLLVLFPFLLFARQGRRRARPSLPAVFGGGPFFGLCGCQSRRLGVDLSLFPLLNPPFLPPCVRPSAPPFDAPRTIHGFSASPPLQSLPTFLFPLFFPRSYASPSPLPFLI